MTKRHICNPRIKRARAINLEPWTPLPGMTKKQCLECEFWYATANRGQELCHDCLERQRRGRGGYGEYRGRPGPVENA
jgi:hypothetical protein